MIIKYRFLLPLFDIVVSEDNVDTGGLELDPVNLSQ